VKPDVPARAEEALAKAHVLLLEKLVAGATGDRAKELNEAIETVRASATAKR
jgi:hypothetical protein